MTNRCLTSEDLSESVLVLLQGVFDSLREETWEKAPTREGRGRAPDEAWNLEHICCPSSQEAGAG